MITSNRIPRVLVACEYSGAVRRQLRARGIDAWSCDLLPAEDGSEFHIQADVRYVIYGGNGSIARSWDGLIAFPPCTDLASSGARWFPEKIADGRQGRSLAFVRSLWQAPIKHIAIENPIGILSRAENLGKPTQIVQPWQFGHGETKATCLWLKGLPKLIPTNIVPGREQRIWKMAPSENRWRERSRTFEGIATAMAAQWSEVFAS